MSEEAPTANEKAPPVFSLSARALLFGRHSRMRLLHLVRSSCRHTHPLSLQSQLSVQTFASPKREAPEA